MKQKVTVIGLGYVGFPLLCAIAKSGKFEVFGLTRSKKRALDINNGIPPIDDNVTAKELKEVKVKAVTSPKKCLPQSDIIAICVPTPIYKNQRPNLQPVIRTSQQVAKYLKRGQTIILESTVNPGVCQEVVLPILESSGLKGGIDFELSHCPERINPGDLKWNIYNIPRNVGSLTKEGCRKTAIFYRSFIKATVNEMDTLKEAESTKIVENSFRDLNIAFVNELAQSFDKMGINLVNVLKGAANKPFAFLPHYPGCGVGGHCIPVDPYYLIHRAKAAGFNHELLKKARKINNSMPKYTVNLLLQQLKANNIELSSIKVGILGLAYKQNIADVRESPAKEVIKYLKKLGANLEIFDPFVKKASTVNTLDEILAKCQAIIVCTNHTFFIKELDGNRLKYNNVRFVIDGRNCLDADSIRKFGIDYKGIGYY